MSWQPSGAPSGGLHWLGAVDVPGVWQKPPTPHSEFTVQGAPLFVPPTQRLPPQTVAPTATQSALVPHGVDAALSQVSQKHFSEV